MLVTQSHKQTPPPRSHGANFDPAERAFYYARVIEIPTPRWTVFDEVRFGIKMDKEVTRILQERAYTSPIWYTP